MALQRGQASDRVDAGGLIGQVYRYALAVHNPTGHGYLGVVLKRIRSPGGRGHRHWYCP